jgi:non-specific serine/threonine protein kinase
MLPRRQQTLRAAIDWSYDLLNDAEKALFCRMSVFAGGWTLEAAERVCAGDGIDTDDVLDLVTELFDKSLVLAEQREDLTRYRMLETVRQYAHDRLVESGDERRWRHQHVVYFLEVAEEAEPRLRGPDQQLWLDRLQAEHDNMRSALAWSCAEPAESVSGLRLAGTFWTFWLMRGHFDEGRSWLSRSLAVVPVEQDLPARARALRGRGVFAELEGDYQAARTLYEESIAIYRELGERRGIASCLSNLGSVAGAQGDDDAAQALWQESLVIRRELGDPLGVADLLGHLGKAAYQRGDHESARAMWEESLAISRGLRDRWGMSFSLSNLGRVALDQRDSDSARAMWKESREISRDLGDRWGYAWSLMDLGDLASAQDNYSAAEALHLECLAIRRDLGNRPSIADSLERLAHVALVLAEPFRAARLWGTAERLREELGVPLSADERLRYERLVESARDMLDDPTAFDLAWQGGRAMTIDQAVAYALRSESDA